MTGLDRHEHNPAAAGFDGVPPDDLIGGPVCALDENIRLKSLDDLAGCPPGKSRPPRPRPVRPALRRVRLGRDRSRRALVAPHRGVGVHPHYQRVAERAGSFEISNVPGVEQIENAVGEDDRLSRAAQLSDELDGSRPRQHAALTGAIDSHGSRGADRLSGPVNVIAAENCHECFGR